MTTLDLGAESLLIYNSEFTSKIICKIHLNRKVRRATLIENFLRHCETSSLIAAKLISTFAVFYHLVTCENSVSYGGKQVNNPCTGLEKP
jgi:hypothetical protein